MTKNLDCKNDVLFINGYEVSLGGLAWLLDTIDKMSETEIVDVDVCENDVVCTFADGEKQTAHCHPEDEERWSLDTGISVCLGKYLAGGSSNYNRIVRHGEKIFKDKIRAEAKEIEDLIEKERIRENKRQKHERYLKRRAERQAAEHSSSNKTSPRDFLVDLLNNLGVKIELVIEE